MKIGIDLTPLLRGKKTGVGWYAFNLIKNIRKIDKENIYVLYGSSLLKYFKKNEIKKFFKSENFYICVKPFPCLIYNFILQRFLPIEFLYGKFNIIHNLYPFSTFNLYGKQIVTVHDLIPLIYPYLTEPLSFQEFKFNITKVIKRADKIITVSYSTKKDIIKFFNISPEMIEVIHLAADEIYRPIEDEKVIDYIKKRYGVDDRYILYVGTIEPRKNIPRLIDAFVIVKEKFPEYKLVLCGKIGWKSDFFYRKIREVPEKIKKDIILTGYVPLSDLPYLYNRCEVFVYPSLYEGFGLPVLEAMRCGVPVITSNVSSLPEVVGDAGILINPENKEEIVEAILSVLNSEDLKKTLSRKGLERAKLFSWEKTAKETIGIYKKIAQI
ncbi:MAG: glycosyltransferase family 4 protein [Candidatus Omnitrophica bacterium]|nr:glycosyltransferase family 4 protein [Candidatus Omnitrophota bacterium]MCM8802021.1 glycosyltransferase family 4 protein [Candidatus Omnitrophota bacterium]